MFKRKTIINNNRMKNEYRILAISILVMLCLNFFGSIASRIFDFNYAYLSPLSFILYGLIGYLISKQQNLKTGTLFAAILGFTESTIGSFVAKLFGEPNTAGFQMEMTMSIWIFTIIMVTILASFSGLIGGVIARSLKKKGK
ncbi:MAG: hypothetical protein ACPG6V_02655 [Flavobacteriales bacterium]